MKRFLLMHIGFESPTPEKMSAWNRWFAASASCTVENIGLRQGREIGPDGARELPMDREAITGFTIIAAASFAEAEKIAVANPFTTSIRIYEVA